MKKIFAILLAVVVVALSLDVGLAYHYCGGSLAEVKLIMGYGEAGCGMEGDGEEPCNSHAFTSSTCCKNQLHQIETDEFQFHKKPLDISVSYTLLASFVKKILLGPDTPFKKVIFIKPPPDIAAVSLPLIQVFLI